MEPIADSLTPNVRFLLFFHFVSFHYLRLLWILLYPFFTGFSNCDFFCEILNFFYDFFSGKYNLFSITASVNYHFSYKIRYGILSLSTDNAMRIVL